MKNKNQFQMIIWWPSTPCNRGISPMLKWILSGAFCKCFPIPLGFERHRRCTSRWSWYLLTMNLNEHHWFLHSYRNTTNNTAVIIYIHWSKRRYIVISWEVLQISYFKMAFSCKNLLSSLSVLYLPFTSSCESLCGKHMYTSKGRNFGYVRSQKRKNNNNADRNMHN